VGEKPIRSPVLSLSKPARVRAFRLTVAALVLVSVPALWLALGALRIRLGEDASAADTVGLRWSLVAGSLTLVGAAAAIVARRWWARWIAIPGVLLCQFPIALHALHAPALALVGWGWTAALLYLVFRQSAFLKRSEDPKEGDDTGAVLAQAVLTSGAVALLLSAYAAGIGVMSDPIGRFGIVTLLLMGCGIASVAEFYLVRKDRLDVRVAGVTAVIGALSAIALFPSDEGSILRYAPMLGALRLVIAVAGAARSHELRADVLGFLWTRPALLLILTFSALSLVGGLVLTFPVCSADDRPLEALDALFTAVSAVCVTGLTVVDTATDFTFVGQLVILLLIQVGALGIMTLSAFATLAIGGAIGGHTEDALREVAGLDGRAAMRRLLGVIIKTTLLVEAVGAVCLLPTFLGRGLDLGEAIWGSLFHAVSAFCNAGFTLQSDSLVLFQSSPLALHTIALLIVIGGIGFGVLMGASELWRRRRGPMSLHVKLVLTTNAVLLGVAFFGWLVSEWNGSLAGMGMGERLNNAWFQSVTMRTAGFTSVEFGALSHATILIMLVWMFIGASPGSTGGGIKTTTIAVLFAAVASVVRGRDDAEAFGRRLARRVVYRAAAIATISAAVVFVGSLALMLTQGSSFEETLFEATSAFGTVGLSLGITGDLDHTGKLIVMMLMLVGRTGPLTMALVFRRQDPMPVRYPEEEVMVG